jgi:hypothetical protein
MSKKCININSKFKNILYTQNKSTTHSDERLSTKTNVITSLFLKHILLFSCYGCLSLRKHKFKQ